MRSQHSHIQLYKKGYKFKKKPYGSSTNNNIEKHIVFDLDETIGAFSSLDIMWRGLIELKTVRPSISFTESQENFNELLDLYPEFLRVNILDILSVLVKKKEMGECQGIHIYTNNQCPPIWIDYIVYYLSKKLYGDYADIHSIFDKIILAFKIKNQQIQMERTTSNKSYPEIIHCTMIDESAEICFIDNSFYKDMKHKKVYYIQPKSYIHNLDTIQIIDRLISSEFYQNKVSNGHSNDTHFWYNWFNVPTRRQSSSPYSSLASATGGYDKIVSEKIMYYLNEFFYLTAKRPLQTRKIQSRLSRRSRKNHMSS